MESIKNSLNDKGISHDDHNPSHNKIAPSFLNTDIQNATYHIHYKYMTMDMKYDDMNEIQNSAHPLKDPVLELDCPDLVSAIKWYDTRKYL